LESIFKKSKINKINSKVGSIWGATSARKDDMMQWQKHFLCACFRKLWQHKKEEKTAQKTAMQSMSMREAKCNKNHFHCHQQVEVPKQQQQREEQTARSWENGCWTWF